MKTQKTAVFTFELFMPSPANFDKLAQRANVSRHPSGARHNRKGWY
jgi:hypothetical protein